MLTALDPSDIELHALQRGSTVLRFQAGLAAPCLPLAVLVMSAPLSMAWAGSLHRTSQHLGERERERHLPELSLSLSLSSPQQRYRPLRLHSASLTPPHFIPLRCARGAGFLARCVLGSVWKETRTRKPRLWPPEPAHNFNRRVGLFPFPGRYATQRHCGAV